MKVPGATAMTVLLAPAVRVDASDNITERAATCQTVVDRAAVPDFGQHLLIASSRACDLPANLEGVRNEHLTPAWHADDHRTINLQMNDWLVDVCNLSDTFALFLRFLERFRPSSEQPAITTGATGPPFPRD